MNLCGELEDMKTHPVIAGLMTSLHMRWESLLLPALRQLAKSGRVTDVSETEIVFAAIRLINPPTDCDGCGKGGSYLVGPCAHVLCESCANVYVEGDDVQCPNCSVDISCLISLPPN